MSNNNEINNDNIIERQPLKLLKNRSFPTYQLYATVANSKTDLDKALIIAVLEVMSWLRKRFREFEIPNEIKYPEPDDYEKVNLDDFHSFRINEGYTVDVMYIKKKGTWAFSLIEPDLGPDPGNENQKRQPIPGRIFETNIAFKIYNGKLECGFKTICSEPVGNISPCEVFRLAVVKSIAKNNMLGLEQIIPIVQEPYEIDSNDKVEFIIDYIKSNKRQLPFVLIADYCKKIDLNDFKVDLDNPKLDLDYLLNRNISIPTVNKAKQGNNEIILKEKINDLIKHRMGYGQFGILQNKYLNYFNNNLELYKVSNGDIRVIYPVQFKTPSKLYNHNYIVSNECKFFKGLQDELQDYPKYKNIDYGNVKFMNEARIEGAQQIIDMSNSKEDIINAYEEEIKGIEDIYENKIQGLNDKIVFNERKIDKLKEKIKDLESKNDEWILKTENIKKKHEAECDSLVRKLKRKDKLLDRPEETEDIPMWVDKYFCNRLIFHTKAKDLITKTPTSEVDMNLLCDTIEFLAHEYRDEKIGKINLEERNMLCSELYNRSFEVLPSGDMSVKYYSIDYKVKYGVGPTGKSKEEPLNLHLKVGNETKNLLRIYFFFDKEKRLVVVGSLPKHLKTMTEK